MPGQRSGVWWTPLGSFSAVPIYPVHLKEGIVETQDVKSYLAGLCLAALLTGGALVVPGSAFGSGSGCSTNGTKVETSGDGPDDDEVEPDEEIEEEPEGGGA